MGAWTLQGYLTQLKGGLPRVTGAEVVSYVLHSMAVSEIRPSNEDIQG